MSGGPGMDWMAPGAVGKTDMSSGERAYLILVLVGFGVFSLALGWYSLAQSRIDRRAATPARAQADHGGPMTAAMR